MPNLEEFLALLFIFLVKHTFLRSQKLMPLQVTRLNRRCKILACAPSNCAADLIAERLLDDIPSEDVIRLHAKSRNL